MDFFHEGPVMHKTFHVLMSPRWTPLHYGNVIMRAIAYQITSLTIVYSTVYSDADQRKHQSSASLAFVWGIHQGPVNSPYKWAVTRKCFHLMTSSWSPWITMRCLHICTSLDHFKKPDTLVSTANEYRVFGVLEWIVYILKNLVNCRENLWK